MLSPRSSIEDNEIPYEEPEPEPPSSNEDSYDLFSACQTPCVVVLKRLTQEEIEFHTKGAADRPKRTHKQIAKHYLKDVARVDFGLFDQYKRSRENFLNRRKRNHASAEYGDFEFSSSEEAPNAASEDDEYVPEVSHKKKKRRSHEDDDEEYDPKVSHKKKKRKFNYEEDDDWSPGMEDAGYLPSPKKTLKNLRVNTRRKRIESNSSSEDEDFEGYEDIYNADAVFEEPKSKSVAESYEEASFPEAKNSKDVSFSSSTILDTDLVSQIMREMEDFNRQTGVKPGSSSPEGGRKSLESAPVECTRLRQRRRISRVLKITDNLTPTIQQVQEVVKNMVNSVCRYEKDKKLAYEESRKRTCKWCDSRFEPQRQNEELCKICRDVERRSTTPKTNKKRPRVRAVCSKPGGLNKIKRDALKVLPKYEQRRLTYIDSNSTKKQDVLESNPTTTVVAEVHPTPPSDVTNLLKGKQIKTNLVSAGRVIKPKKSKKNNRNEPGSLQSISDENATSIPSIVGDNNSKGLLKVDFSRPVSSAGLSSSGALSLQTIEPKQPITNNVQYGTYLLPPVPTVIVANYAATDAKSGDYYLSSVYYQNEMTQSKTAPAKNDGPTSQISATKTNSLPSMPSIDQLSNTFPEQPSKNSSISFTPSGDSSTFRSLNTSIETRVSNSTSITNQVNTKNNYNFTLENLNLLLNNPNFQIQSVQPRTSSVVTTDISSLFSNPQLKIQPQIQAVQPRTSSVATTDISSLFLNPQLKIQPQIQAVQPRTSSVATTDISSLFSNSQLNILPVTANEELPFNFMEEDLQDEINNTESFTTGEELNLPSGDIQQNSFDDMQPSFEESTICKETSKPLNNSQGTKPSFDSKRNETSEDELSSEALFRKMSIEIDAIAIVGIVDLERNPRFTLENSIKSKKQHLESLQNNSQISVNQMIEIQKIEESLLTLQQARTLLGTFGSFEKLTKSLLLREQILQIKKEKNLEQEEEHSACQYSQSQAIPEFIDINEQHGFSLDDIPNIEINPIQPADNSQFGSVHHFPVPASIPRSESRDTPSRGSGPVTPARPESAMSQVEEPALTPIQIKKEKMEAASLPSPSQCSFTSPPPVRTPVVAKQLSFGASQPQQQMHTVQQPINHVQQQQMNNVQQQQMNNVQQQQMNNVQQQQMNNVQQQQINNVQQQINNMKQQQQIARNVQQQQMIANIQQQQQAMMNFQPQQQVMQPQQQMIQQQQRQILQPQQQMMPPQQQILQPQQQSQQQQYQQQMSNVQQQQLPQVSMSMTKTQDHFNLMNEMTRKLQPPTPQVNNTPQLRNVLIAPNNNRQQILPNGVVQQHYQPNNRQQPSPNVTVSSHQNISNVLFNLAQRNNNLQQQSNNYVFKNSGQMVNVQQQSTTQTTNVVYKTTPMVNVQQVYLPSGNPPRYQAQTNQYNIQVHQGSSQPQLMVNNTGQTSGYPFQGQMQAQQSPLVQQQNPVQQSQVVQSAQNPSFLMPNSRVLLLEIQRPR